MRRARTSANLAAPIMRPSTPHDVAGAAVALLCWSWYSRLLGFGPAGWWSYPRWWHPAFPSYFQIGALVLPFILFRALCRVLPPNTDFALATVIAAVTAFPQDPSTDVAFITLTLPFQTVFFVGGCAFASHIPHRLQKFSSLPFPVLLSVLVPLISIVFLRGVYDADYDLRIIKFFVLHIGAPAQIAALLLHRRVARGTTESTA